MTTAAVEKIPKLLLTSGDVVDSSGEKIGCSVCLQVREITKNRLRLLKFEDREPILIG